jgi:hypothetical protein
MSFADYVVPFVGLAYFVGGYVVGKCHTRRITWGIHVDPDPIELTDSPGPAEVVSLFEVRNERDRLAV